MVACFRTKIRPISFEAKLVLKESKQKMKIQILCAVAVLGLLNGCAWTGKHVGASDYNDQNVLTGEPSPA